MEVNNIINDAFLCSLVMVSYCKQVNAAMTPATMASAASKSSTPSGMAAVAAAQWSVSNATNNGTQAPVAEASFTKEEIPRMAEYSASLYAKTPEEHASYLQ